VSAALFSASARSPQALTDREREIVGLVTKGLPNKAIAHSLTVSKRTVDAHLAHLFTKLGVSSRAELVAWAARHPHRCAGALHSSGRRGRRDAAGRDEGPGSGHRDHQPARDHRR
jgi:DNA-binding CsgD family transcriptional regulator